MLHAIFCLYKDSSLIVQCCVASQLVVQFSLSFTVSHDYCCCFYCCCYYHIITDLSVLALFDTQPLVTLWQPYSHSHSKHANIFSGYWNKQKLFLSIFTNIKRSTVRELPACVCRIHQFIINKIITRGSAVERQSLASILSPSCARPVADRWPLMWISRPL